MKNNNQKRDNELLLFIACFGATMFVIGMTIGRIL